MSKRKVARRKVLLGALLSLFQITSLTTSNSAQSIVPTLTPRKVGQTIIWRGKKYTAIKSGKRIIWDKGVPIPQSTKSAQTTKTSASPGPSQSVKTESPTLEKINVVGKTTDIQLGETKIFKENDPYGRGARYAITRTDQGLVAFDNTCTHEGCGVEQILAKNHLRCGCHGAEFNAVTGEATKGPAYQALKQVKVSEVNGEILIG